MRKLDFEHTTTGGEEHADYRGLTIRAVIDTNPQNPFVDWDCEPPILISYDGGFQEYGLDKTLPVLTREQIKANTKELLEAINLNLNHDLQLRSILNFCQTHSEYPSTCWNGVEQYFESAAENFYEMLRASDGLRFLAAIYRISGVPCQVITSTGHTQSSWADVLVVLNDDWYEATGVSRDHDSAAAIEETVELYGQWAWGDVYGYAIEIDGDEDAESCWGYYGSDHNKSGLAETAMNAADCHLNQLLPVERVHCDKCGGQNVVADASAQWSVPEQEYQHTCTQDAHDCDDCNDECTAVGVTVMQTRESINAVGEL